MYSIRHINELLLKHRELAVAIFVSKPTQKNLEQLRRSISAYATFNSDDDMQRDNVIRRLEEELDVAAAVLRVAKEMDCKIKDA